MKIEKVIFDLGKVLVKFNPRNPFKNILKSEDDINFFLKNICTWEWHVNQDIVFYVVCSDKEATVSFSFSNG